MLLLSIVLLVASITCPFWAYVLDEEGTRWKHIGVFGYLFRSDIKGKLLGIVLTKKKNRKSDICIKIV